MSSIPKLSLWNKFFTQNKDLDSSNYHFDKIKKAVSHSNSFSQSFEEISKNEGIAFLILDPTESHLQLLHHGHAFGGNWSNPSKKMVAILGTDSDAKPVQIVAKSIKNVKAKSYSFEDLVSIIELNGITESFNDPDLDFHFKNILPIPNLLTKIFINLKSTEPLQVAKAFAASIPAPDKSFNQVDVEKEPSDIDADDRGKLDDEESGRADSEDLAQFFSPQTGPTVPSVDDILYVIQFCQLCSIGKIPPVLYSLASDSEVSHWFNSLPALKQKKTSSIKRHNPSTPDSDSDSEISSPENKISKKDHYLINTMMKLHDTMDKSSKTKEEKEPGFKRLESHRKQLILNASAVPPFTRAATSPTEFYTAFLAKKSQFKAKDMLVHRFYNDKIAFNPNTTFITNMWNSEFFWLMPDHPSGISIFYCPETKSVNTQELERERSLALVDKVNALDLEKLSKQKMSLPATLMDLVWTTQNFHAVVSLCFGPESHSASFLQSWIDHMYDNRLRYSSFQASDPYFFAKVLFTIDNALQTHWHSCSSVPDRSSVNDNILRMSDIQASVLSLNFNQHLPKVITIKFLPKLLHLKMIKIKIKTKVEVKEGENSRVNDSLEQIKDCKINKTLSTIMTKLVRAGN